MPAADTTEQFQPRLWATIIGLAAIALYLVAFIYKNSGKVTLHFIFFSAHVGLIWLLLLGFVLGLVVGVLASQLYGRRRRHGAG
jgi:uncharacterized integral membrane protein